MKRIKLLTALSIGVLASSSGMIQAGAALYTFNVDFSTKEVVNFNDFRPTYSIDTYDLTASIITRFAGTYFFDSCPTAFTVNVTYNAYARLNGAGTIYQLGIANLPDFVCSTTPQTYSATITTPMNSLIVGNIMQDDTNYSRFYGDLFFAQTAATSGRIMTLRNYEVSYILEYDFDTTYLFNFFLSDTRFANAFRSGSWNKRSDSITNVDYVFTTAGNDEYRIINTDVLNNLGNLRKKYAVNYNDEFFRGISVGAKIARRYSTEPPFDTDLLTMAASGTAVITDQYDYYFLNTSNFAQAIVDAPIINFTEENCSGGFLDVNVGCYVNNALAYIVNDAPVISDAFTLLNTGIELAAQTFGIIGNFSDDNVFGYLILVGFGFIAVKWFLKNDE